MSEKVLLIADDEGLCDLIMRLFSQEGCAVDTASHAETALKLIFENPYDLILCRDFLPVADPFALISEIKRRYPAVVIVVITDSASPVESSWYSPSFCPVMSLTWVESRQIWFALNQGWR